MAKKIYGDEGGDREQWAKLKGAPLKDKIAYFFTYYGIATAIVLFVLIFLVSFISSYIKNSRPTVISGDFNTSLIREGSEAELKAILCERLQMNPAKTNIAVASALIDGSDIQMAYTQSQKTFARIAAADLDFIVADAATVNSYMSKEEYGSCAFLDLREVLPEADMKNLEDAGKVFYYTLDDGTTFPYMIDLNGTYLSKFFELAEVRENSIAVAATTKHADAVREMIEWMLENDEK